MHGFKSAILAIFQFLQNGTFELVHEIWNFFLTKSILLKRYENDNTKKNHKTSQGLPNPGFMQEKVQKEGFQKNEGLKL